jgi:NlpC/P60 family
MATANRAGISGLGVGIASVGALLLYSAFTNVPVMELLRELAGGKLPAPRPKEPFKPVTIDWTGTATSLTDMDLGANSSAILAAAEAVAKSAPGRRNYCWGGGHGRSNPCTARCFDCSGYASCVLNKLGLMKGSKNTTAFRAWGGLQKVAWSDRKPGDFIISTTHMGIAIDGNTMWNAQCTKCGPVKKSSYGLGKGYSAYRVKNASNVGFGSGGVRGG